MYIIKVSTPRENLTLESFKNIQLKKGTEELMGDNQVAVGVG